MEPLELVRQYLPRGRMMQIATASGDQPWICTVYFVEDDDLNLYWLSFPTRRHSQEIAAHSKVAVAVPIKFDKPVIGIQAEGVAEPVTDKQVVADVMRRYVERYNSGGQFYDLFVAGKNQHVMYKFTPSKYVLFDEVTFPGDARKEISLG
jgi:uncharacterized protein YhbP (UPF0306 family)